MTDTFDKSALRIMLLDDDPFMLKLIGRLLENLGYTTVAAHTSGIAALAALADPGGPPDLILLDLNMPEMDGIEFVRHLVERCYAGSLILISGEDERMLAAADKLMRAHQITVLGRVAKPVAPEALGKLLDQYGHRLPHPEGATLPRNAPPMHCARPSSMASWSTTTNPRRRWPTAAWSASKPWCAGGTRQTAWCIPTSSSASPRRTA